MSTKYSPTLILLLIGVVIQLAAGWDTFSLGTAVIGIAIILGVLNFFKIGISGDSGHRGHILLLTVVLGILIIFGVTLGGLIPKTTGTPALTIPSKVNEPASLPAAASGQSITAKYIFYPSGQNGGTYGGSGIVYLLAPTLSDGTALNDRYDFMKVLADGNTGLFLAPDGKTQASSISVSSNAYTKNYFAGKVGDSFKMCGYLDNTPANAENVSWCKTVQLTGITAGSTPEWMYTLDGAGTDFMWRNYAALDWYDSSDTSRTIYAEAESSAIQRTFTLYAHPGVNGQQVGDDTTLYIETPSSNAGSFKKVKITSPNGKSVEYTAFQSTSTMSSGDPRFIAAPALTNSTHTSYYAGTVPEAAVRTSTSSIGKYTIEVTYDHPASNSVLTYLKLVQNAKAKTVTGGHFDDPASGFLLWMNATGSDTWT